MTPTVFGIAWLAAKAGMFGLTSLGVITGLQKFHDFQVVKKQPTTPKQPRRRGVDQNVRTGEDAIERIKDIREVHTAE